MDNQKIAERLVAMARELVARRFSISEGQARAAIFVDSGLWSHWGITEDELFAIKGVNETGGNISGEYVVVEADDVRKLASLVNRVKRDIENLAKSKM